jgi:hypothetical protein
MNTSVSNQPRHSCFLYRFSGLALAIALFSMPRLALGQMFLAEFDANKVGEFTTSGATINGSLITEASEPYNMAVSGNDIFIVNRANPSAGGDTISEYTTGGVLVNANLAPGLSSLNAIAVSGNDLFVSTGGAIAEYSTSGSLVNPNLVSGLSAPTGIAISGTNLFVTDGNNQNVGEYTTSGITVNANLISGLGFVNGLAISGNDIFTLSNFGHTVGEYTTSGATVNASLLSDASDETFGIALLGNDLFLAKTNGITGFSSISEYTTGGTVVNNSLISGLSPVEGIVVVPEPSTYAAWCAVAALALVIARRRYLQGKLAAS